VHKSETQFQFHQPGLNIDREEGSDVARTLSYKTKTIYFFKTETKTTFSRPRPRLHFLKTIKLLIQDY